MAPQEPLTAKLSVPGDKSIAHRALLLNAVAEGVAVVAGAPAGRDVASTVTALRSLGVGIRRIDERRLEVLGGGPWRAGRPIDCGNSGTTARFLLGLLAPRASAPAVLAGDGSLSRRPMGRVVRPLVAMGAAIEAAGESPGGLPDRLPLVVTGARLRGGLHRLPVASAQVKSALLVAGLVADGETVVEEPGPSRDHTERLLTRMGAQVERHGFRVTIRPGTVQAHDVDVPGDFSSAAPFLALAAARPGAEVTIENVGLNPTRTGFLEILRAMGAHVEADVIKMDPEPRGNVRVRGVGLTGVQIDAALVPRAIDELPLVAVLGTQAEGETVVAGAAELRVKESDRIHAIVDGLRRMGASLEPFPDGFAIRGPTRLAGADLDAAGDHRIGMALAVAALLAGGESALSGAEWVDVSYPGFFASLAGPQTVKA